MSGRSLSILFFTVLAAPAWGSISFNGSPGTIGGGIFIDTRVGAEFFDLSATTTLRGVEFVAELPGVPSTFDWYIFDNSGFFPGAILAQGENPLMSITPLNQFLSIVDFDLNTPVTLAAGTYWVGVNAPGQFGIWGATTTPDNQNSGGHPLPLSSGGWTLNGVQLYLGVSDTELVAPEPGSMLLAGLGIAFLVCWRNRVCSSVK